MIRKLRIYDIDVHIAVTSGINIFFTTTKYRIRDTLTNLNNQRRFDKYNVDRPTKTDRQTESNRHAESLSL